MSHRHPASPPDAPAGSRFDRPLILGRVAMRECVLEGDVTLGAHGHGEAFASLVLSGHAVEVYRGRSRVLSPGTATLNAPGETHAARIGSAGLRTFEVVLLAGFWNEAGLPEPKGHGSSGELEESAWLLRRLHAEYQEPDRDSRLSVGSLAAELGACLGSGVEAPEWRPPWLGGLLEQLQDDDTGSLMLSDLAKAHGVHPSHLARTFRARFGCTVGQYVRRRRVVRACRALRETEAPLGRVALETGFSDQPHFCRVFKRVVGTTPGRFRRFVQEE